jgi:hypothetical protein
MNISFERILHGRILLYKKGCHIVSIEFSRNHSYFYLRLQELGEIYGELERWFKEKSERDRAR